jgi:hypothetical protein
MRMMAKLFSADGGKIRRNLGVACEDGPGAGPTGNFCLDGTGIYRWARLRREFRYFRMEIPGEHFLSGKSDFFQEHITGEHGFAGNSANISFCPFTLLTSGYA